MWAFVGAAKRCLRRKANYKITPETNPLRETHFSIHASRRNPYCFPKIEGENPCHA
jgi:hypothetical protein